MRPGQTRTSPAPGRKRDSRTGPHRARTRLAPARTEDSGARPAPLAPPVYRTGGTVRVNSSVNPPTRLAVGQGHAGGDFHCQNPRPSANGGAADPEMGRRFHLCQNRRRLVLRRCCRRLFSCRVVVWPRSAGMTAQLVTGAMVSHPVIIWWSRALTFLHDARLYPGKTI